MSRRSRRLHLPLKNITASFNSTMSCSSDSGKSTLANSPMTSLAFNLSELSTGRSSPKLRRKLSLSSVDTPPNDCIQSDQEFILSAESGCFSGSPLEDSPTLERLNVKRYKAVHHPDIPLEAFSVRKKTIAFRIINSQPLPTMRLDSPTDFLDEDKSEQDDEGVRNLNGCSNDSDETMTSENCDNIIALRRSKFYSDDATSQDSGLGFESDRSQRSSVSSFDDAASTSSSSSSMNNFDRLPSLDDIWNSVDSPSFKAPRGVPPKRSRNLIEDKQFSEDTCSPIKYSPVKNSSLPRPSFSKALFSQIPEAISEDCESNRCPPVDGFEELFQLTDMDHEADAKVSSLISATLFHRADEDKPEEVSIEDRQKAFKRTRALAICKENDTPSSRPHISRRGLYRSMSMDNRTRPSSKRCEPSSDDSTPVQYKRWKGEESSTSSVCHEENNKTMNVRRFQRSHSETEAIKSAVSRMLSEPDLIGDCSKAYCLPTVSGKHQDLKSITPETLSRLMANEFSDIIEEYHIIDCRYPYEYQGGHIQNALNIYTKDDVIEKYLKTPLFSKDPSKRMILVFHCEFSSERGPGL
ncbi:unnamed protein product, partial [Candidula unifasciata]